MKSGLTRIKKDRRDFDFHKSYGTVLNTQGLPAEYLVDANLWMPNQNIPQSIPGIGIIPALPYGCTDYAQTDLCVDEDTQLYNPMLLEAITHANANEGGDIRAALNAAKNAFKRTAYFNITAQGPIDPFDAARLAMYSGQPEKRAVSIGSMWYANWEQVGADGVLSMPPDPRVGTSLHNWVGCGWETYNSILYLRGKSLQGPSYGFGGYHRISREVFNAIMAQSGTGMFTLSKVAPTQIQVIDLTWVENIVSFIRNLFGM